MREREGKEGEREKEREGNREGGVKGRDEETTQFKTCWQNMYIFRLCTSHPSKQMIHPPVKSGQTLFLILILLFFFVRIVIFTGVLHLERRKRS